MKEQITEEKKAEPKKETKTLVVEQFPTQPVNVINAEDGNEYNLITRDEALSEILEIARQMKKGLL